jgi:hypothetical protein
MGEQHPRDTVAHPANGCAECREPLLDSLSADPTTTASLVKWVCGAIFDTYGSAPQGGARGRPASRKGHGAQRAVQSHSTRER